jgi:hypothetical protein
VDVYAITLDREPRVLGTLEPDALRKVATLVGSEAVRAPVPPAAPAKEGAPPVTPLPPAPGVDQGAVVVLREQLTPELRTPATLPDQDEEPEVAEAQDVPRALVAPVAAPGPQRYYFAVAVSPRGRHSPHTGLQSAPLGDTSAAPSRPEITVAETSATIKWTPAPDARGVITPPDRELLPSRSLLPAPPPTTYDVYEVSSNATPDGPVAIPAPLNEAPVSTTEFTQQKITLGAKRCFVVRPVDMVDGVAVRGPASPSACASFVDTFAPPAPRELLAAAIPGAVNLIWEASESPDLAGYLVLRGESGSDTLTPLTATPITDLRYRDEAVKSGVRYTYAIVAVDRAGNRSDESNRVEETAR